MFLRRRPIKSKRALVVAAVLLLAAALAVALLPCPCGGLAVTPSGRALIRLKSRDAEPRPEDFDPRATLDAVLETGEDAARWSERRAARFEGYVVDVFAGPMEAANCFSPARRDVHINVARSADAPARAVVVAEVTPRTADAARARGEDWSAEALRRRLVGRRARIEGWLLFDRGHAGEAENTAPGRAANWRATAWELHPVTRIEVLE